jgi:D-arginine dehydrogenase
VDIDVLIIGAGFAGASTAFHLTRSGFSGSILLVEKEEVPGYHASGRNASMVLQAVDNPPVREIVARSVVHYLEHAEEVGYAPVGSLLLGRPSQLEPLREPDRIRSDILTPEQVRRQVPLLEGHSFDAALFTPSDGVMDISRLLQFYLDHSRTRGLQIRLNCPVVEIDPVGDGFEVLLQDGSRVSTRLIVNGAGAWAPKVAEMAGIASLPMRSYKRHLFVLEGIDGIHPDWPFVWSVERSFYFRPESGGLLFSVCDEELATSGFIPTINPEIAERLAELISRQLPNLERALQRREWSCFRTKTPDGQFHLGFSEQLPGLLWVAGLGGHGMGASWEVGHRAAGLVRERLG